MRPSRRDLRLGGGPAAPTQSRGRSRRALRRACVSSWTDAAPFSRQSSCCSPRRPQAPVPRSWCRGTHGSECRAANVAATMPTKNESNNGRHPRENYPLSAFFSKQRDTPRSVWMEVGRCASSRHPSVNSHPGGLSAASRSDRTTFTTKTTSRKGRGTRKRAAGATPPGPAGGVCRLNHPSSS